MNVASKDDSPISYEYLKGNGQPIILLHGWGQSSKSMKPLAQLLLANASVYLLDLPGFGNSPAPKKDWDTLDYAECVLRFMDEIGVNKATFIGHSFGGRIAVRISGVHPTRVEKLILIGGHGLRPVKSIKKTIRSLLIGKLRWGCKTVDNLLGTKTFSDWFIPRFASRDYMSAGVLKNTFVKTVNEDLSSTASHIQASTLLLYGDRDMETPLNMGRRYQEIIPHSKLIVLEGHGHFPFEDVGSHLCAYYCLKFLRELNNQR